MSPCAGARERRTYLYTCPFVEHPACPRDFVRCGVAWTWCFGSTNAEDRAASERPQRVRVAIVIQEFSAPMAIAPAWCLSTYCRGVRLCNCKFPSGIVMYSTAKVTCRKRSQNNKYHMANSSDPSNIIVAKPKSRGLDTLGLTQRASRLGISLCPLRLAIPSLDWRRTPMP